MAQGFVLERGGHRREELRLRWNGGVKDLLTIGLEPIPHSWEQILSLSCIPISPSKQRVTGIEPVSSVWKTENLPLIHTRTAPISNAGIARAGVLLIL